MGDGVAPWLVLFGLGIYHGLNPGMGWLFALALGLQERSRRALLQALVPIAIGHFLAIGLVALPTVLLQGLLPLRLLRGGAALALLAIGIYRWIRARHPRWVGLRVGFRELVVWSTLMASSHGAGLMLAPLLLGPLCVAPGYSSGAVWLLGSLWNALGASAVHTLGALLMMGLAAWAVYEWVGLAILRRMWVNMDLLWALVLILTGFLMLLMLL